MSTIMPRYLETFSVLPEEDRRAIVNVGVAFRRIDIEKKLARAQGIIQKFETKYNTTISEFASIGLPDDAGYEMHEDYIMWHHWAGVADRAQQTLEILNLLAENRVE